jgi:hypothetical protein
MSAFLGDGRLIHDPGHNRLPTPPRGQDLGAHRREHGLIALGSFGHPMMQGLAGGLHALRVQASGHGFHGLPLAGQQQAAAGVFERFLFGPDALRPWPSPPPRQPSASPASLVPGGRFT